MGEGDEGRRRRRSTCFIRDRSAEHREQDRRRLTTAFLRRAPEQAPVSLTSPVDRSSVSSTAVPTPAPSRLESASAAFRSAPSRAIAFFSGPVGLAVKIGLLAIVNALAVWAAVLLATDHKWVALAVLVASTVIIDAVYQSPRAYPAKFLIPGTVFLLAFQVLPILYTINVAFDKYSTGHVSSKANAVEAIQQNSLSESAAGTAYTMAVARDDGGKLALVLVDQDTGKTYVGDRDGLKPGPQDSVKTNRERTTT